MRVQNNSQHNPTFQYHSKLMDAYKNGNLKLKKGAYGGKLTPKNASHEHIIPHCKGGADNMTNYIITTKELNHKRDIRPFKEVVEVEPLLEYFDAILNSKCDDFDRIKYIKDIIKTMLKALREGK